MFRVFAVVLLLCSIAFSASAQNSTNGVYLSHNFVVSSTFVSNMGTTCDFMKGKNVKYLFVNVGSLNTNGEFPNPSVTFPAVTSFISAVKTWENANPTYSFKVFAMIGGSSVSTATNYVDSTDSAERNRIQTTSSKFLSTSVSGSFISGATRTFDGVLIDFEPSGLNDPYFNGIKSLMIQLRSNLPNLPSGAAPLLGVCAHKYGTSNSSMWSASNYFYMGLYVDVLCAMTYNSSSTTASAYQTWMQNQAKDIAKAVSGEYWGNDGVHIQTNTDLQVIMGFPVYPSSPYHNPSAETVTAGALGVKAGYNALPTNSFASKTYLHGAAIYQHNDGTGTDGYAGRTTNWVEWVNNWLN